MNRSKSTASYFTRLEQGQRGQSVAIGGAEVSPKGRSLSQLDSQQFTGNTDGSQSSQGKFEALLNLNRSMEMKSTLDEVKERVEELSLTQESEATESRQRLDRLEGKVDSIALEIQALGSYLKGHYAASSRDEEREDDGDEGEDGGGGGDEEMLDVQEYLKHKRTRK